MLESLTDWVTSVVEALGYVGVAALVALESVFPPIPSEVILPLAGFVAGRGDASAPGMVAAATLGSLVGAWVLYGLSAWVGPDRLHAFVGRYGRWLGVRSEDLARAEAWFDRKRTWAVLVGRCVPLIRSLVSVPAGFRRMPIVPFSVLTVLGSAVWNAGLVVAGAILGDRWHRVGDVMGLAQGVVVVAVAGLGVFVLWRRVIRPRLRPSGSPARGPGRGS